MKNILIFTFVIISFTVFSQESAFQKFKNISCAEKRWVLFHPFIAKKVMIISDKARKISSEMLSDKDLDGDGNGGQVDAFRHSFWMASLSKEVRWRAVLKLGKAHEKGNKKYFKKHKLEDGTIPDFISCEMDYLNNDIGIAIGNEQDTLNQIQLIDFIKQEILNGKLYVIKKDCSGNFLNCEGNIIKKENFQGKWFNDKCIVKSNYLKQ
jgi:hypothetical protein